MFVTRATRHDRDDVRALLEGEGWDLDKLDMGTAFIARDGAVVGAVRLIELEPQEVILEDMLVKNGRRKEGIGKRLMETAMNARGGTLYLCCHDDTIEFYERFGFELVSLTETPESVQGYMREHCRPGEDGHEHFIMKAR